VAIAFPGLFVSTAFDAKEAADSENTALQEA
jgi:hypothetical protein